MRILVALSGGVDSAVAAARLQRGGVDVVAVHLRIGVGAEGATAGGGRSCCGADDARDARQIAAQLGVPFYVIDVAEAFSGVLREFVEAYASGRTPNPCVTCNSTVKFGRLREIANDLGCEGVATGHYARVERGPGGRLRLLRALDRSKDQTYVLYRLDQEQLAASRFPLGNAARKADVRAEAAALGLPVATKPDSQDLCFVPDGDYRRYLEDHAPEALVPGEIVDETGRVIGRHDGAAGFTVGQRRGLPALGAPRYVTRVDPGTRRVHVAPRDGALARGIAARDVNWIEHEEPPTGTHIRVDARIRHASEARAADLEVTGRGLIHVTFDEDVFAPAPGQALVAYVGEAVLCGGVIARDGPLPA